MFEGLPEGFVGLPATQLWMRDSPSRDSVADAFDLSVQLARMHAVASVAWRAEMDSATGVRTTNTGYSSTN